MTALTDLDGVLNHSNSSTPPAEVGCAGYAHFSHQLPQEPYRRIRVKFTFPEGKVGLIPDGFHYVPRPDEESVELMHHRFATDVLGKPELAEVGRHREGRVDTGEPVMESNMPCRLALLTRGFAANSYHLYTVWVQIKTQPASKPGKPPKRFHVLNLEFRPWNKNGLKELSRDTVDGLRGLMKMVWGYCKIWSNPDNSVTINIGGLTGDLNVQPKYALVVRHRCLTTDIADPASADDSE